MSYFIGRDRRSWHTGIATYRTVGYRRLWPGIDATFYGHQGRLEYDFRLRPGADPARIGLSLSGAGRVRLLADGALVIGPPGASVRQLAPYAYQVVGGARRPVASGYVVRGARVGIRVGAYDRHRPLVIDPTLEYSTYVGGSDADYGHGVAVDSSGSAYVVGHTASTNFPTSAGSFQSSNAGSDDVFVTKLAPDGKSIVYSTYLGGSNLDGSNQDPGMGIAVDSTGSAYVTGYTVSTDFPTTAGAFQTASGGSGDGFVTKLAPDGNSLAYSTYLGGSQADTGYAIAVDSSGSAYVTGETNSSDFPTTAGAYQTTYGNNYDAFVTKLAPDAKTLVYSTYLGGSQADLGFGIAVDSSGVAYVTGETEPFGGSDNFPVTAGAYQTAFAGSPDAFVTSIASDGKRLNYSTYLGGAGGGQVGRAIAIDSTGSAYVTGTTDSTAFPTTAGAYQTTGSGSFDPFVTKLAPDGKSLGYSTYLGGSGNGYGYAIAVDPTGAAYAAGETDGPGFPTTADAYQTSSGGGGQDAFVTQLAPDGKSLAYSTYLGGSNAQRATGIALDSTGAFYVEGWTSSTNFPTTAGAYQTMSAGNVDAFVSKFSPGSAKRPTATAVSCSPASVSVGQTTTCTATVADTGLEPKSTPTGTVSFSSDSHGTFANPGASCTLTAFGVGKATCHVDYTPSAVDSGTHTVIGSYPADATHQGSSGNFGLTVTKRSTATSVSCVPASVAVGQATSCTATVSDTDSGTSSTPTGTVTFNTDSSGTLSNPGASCTLDARGSCQVDYTPTAVDSGTHTITATYGGDASHAASRGSSQVSVTSSGAGGGSGGGGGGSVGGGGGGGGSTRPIARFETIGVAHTLGHALLFDGGKSISGTGIADYTWSVGSGGQTQAVDPCGQTPLVAISFRTSGIHDLTLRVTDTSGQTSTATQRLNVPAAAVSHWFDASYDCENPGSGNVPNRGDCVKTFAWDVVQVNSRGRPDDCFQLQQRDGLRQPNPASDRAAAARVSPNIVHAWATHATINGPVAIDGLYMPVPESVRSSFDDWNSTIQIGQPIPIAIGPYRLASLGLNAVVGDPVPGTDLVPLLAAAGLSSSNNQLGALPLAGLVDVNLSTEKNADGFNISKIKVHVKLPSPLPQADGYLESDNENGVHVTGFQLGPFDSPLPFGLSLQRAFFKYVGGTDDVWTGGANIYLPFASTGLPQPGVANVGPGIQFSPPPPDLGIGFRRGRLDHFGIGVIFPAALEPPLFPGIGLRDVHFAFGMSPLRFTGGLGVDIGQLVGIDGDVFVAFPTADQPYYFPSDAVPGGNGDLEPLAGRKLDSFTFAVGADAVFHVPILDKIPLLNAWVIYEAPDYFEIGSSFNFDDFLQLTGSGGGWIEPSQGKFSIGGSLSLCLDHVKILGVSIHPCISDGVVVSSRGVGGCATVIVPVPTPFFGVPVPVPVTLTAGYTSDNGFQVIPFSCDLDPFTEANPRGAADRPGGNGATAAAASWSFRLSKRAPSAEVRITGRGGAPDVTLRGPDGRTYSTLNPPKTPGDFRRVMMFQYGNTTLIGLNHPPAGTWTITPAPASVPLVSVAYAKGQPAANVKAHLSGRGRERTLTYTDTPARGRVITFVERGVRTYHIIGVAHGGRGKIRFRLDDARAGQRQIVAQVEDHGVQTQSVVLARYSAPGPERPGRPARVRVTHRGFTVSVRWRAVPGAGAYEILVEPVDGGREMTLVRGNHASVVDIEPGLRGKVLVNAVSAAGLRGPQAVHRFARAPIPGPTRPKLTRHKPTRHHR